MKGKNLFQTSTESLSADCDSEPFRIPSHSRADIRCPPQAITPKHRTWRPKNMRFWGGRPAFGMTVPPAGPPEVFSPSFGVNMPYGQQPVSSLNEAWRFKGR